MTKREHFMSASICLRGHSLNPDHVSTVLGVHPSRTQKTGELKPRSKRFIAKTGLWALSARRKSHSVSEIVDALLQQLGSIAVQLDEIEGCEDAFLDVFVTISHGGKVDGPLEVALTKCQMSRLGELGLSFCLTVA